MVDRSKSIFQAAEAYARAAKCLNVSSQNDLTLLLPSQVNAALALELYFKSLYYLEERQDFKLKGRHSHDFHALFNELSGELRNKLESEFQDIMNNRNIQDIDQIETVSKVKVPRDLAGNLRMWSGVFVQIRYIYDKPTEGRSMAFFPQIEQVVRNAIIQRLPELQP